MGGILFSKDNQLPEEPGLEFGGLFWDDVKKTFCQIDSDGNITCLGSTGGLEFRDILDAGVDPVNFTLTNISAEPDKSILKVNGQVLHYGLDYVISGTALTWQNLNYVLDSTDSIEILYS